MRLHVKAHNGTLNDTVRAYAEKRLAKLEKRLYDQTVVEVTLSREHNPSIRDDHSAEAVVYTKGPNIVARSPWGPATVRAWSRCVGVLTATSAPPVSSGGISGALRDRYSTCVPRVTRMAGWRSGEVSYSSTMEACSRSSACRRRSGVLSVSSAIARIVG